MEELGLDAVGRVPWWPEEPAVITVRQAIVHSAMDLARHAGHAMRTIFVDDLDAFVARIAERGLDPVERETCSNGVRKATYRDPDGNEIGFGGAPL